MNSYNTAVLGAGSWGTALAFVLKQHNNITLWNASSKTLDDIQTSGTNSKYLPEVSLQGIQIEHDLKKAVQDKDIIVIAVPSKFFRELLTQLAPIITDQQIIVSATKGLELNPFQTMTSLADTMLPHKKAVVALSGPSHAEETSVKKFTCLIAASYDNNANKMVQECFSTSWIRVYTNKDPLGVEIGAALKNIIAIAAGMVSAMELGDNTLAAIVTRGLAEMTRFGLALGADIKTFSGLTGIGDLMVTCYSKHSRNRYVGQQLVLGRSLKEIEQSMHQIPEGVRAVKQVYQYAKEHNISMPIINSVYSILYEHSSLDEWKKYLTERPLTHEDNFEI